jgi:hypothetical protein
MIISFLVLQIPRADGLSQLLIKFSLLKLSLNKDMSVSIAYSHSNHELELG